MTREAPGKRASDGAGGSRDSTSLRRAIPRSARPSSRGKRAHRTAARVPHARAGEAVGAPRGGRLTSPGPLWARAPRPILGADLWRGGFQVGRDRCARALAGSRGVAAGVAMWLWLWAALGLGALSAHGSQYYLAHYPTISNKTFIKACLDAHNYYRARVWPRASNMLYMVGAGRGRTAPALVGTASSRGGWAGVDSEPTLPGAKRSPDWGRRGFDSWAEPRVGDGLAWPGCNNGTRVICRGLDCSRRAWGSTLYAPTLTLHEWGPFRTLILNAVSFKLWVVS